MFNPLKVQTIVRGSDAVSMINADLVNAEVCVDYTDGSCYVFTNVSRKAIINLVMNKNISLGFWVNDVLESKNSKCANYGTFERVPA